MCGILASCACPDATLGKNVRPTTASTSTHKSLRENLEAGLDVIKHRGPDGNGVWISQDGHVGLAHCRLSINDLSSRGAQPLHSDDGDIHAVVNGEIYEYDRLRDHCINQHGYTFSSESDSELVIALYKIYGAPGVFEHLRGEFAFVLFDNRPDIGRVIAGRDRFGIKPLVWTVVDNRVLFASEAKAFLPLGWQPEWDVPGITDCHWLVNDGTIFKGVKKLMPGHWIEITEERGVTICKYWDAEYPNKAKEDPRTVEEMIQGTRELLVDSIRLRLRADVPVGVYLSGGIDSSAVAGIVTDLVRKENLRLGSEATDRVSCFSIQFGQESGYDETDIADRTAEWLGINCHKLHMGEQELADEFISAAYHFEHHHMDLNAVAKQALSEFTRQHGVKVVLTGEGSDEHFCGYPSFAAEFLREPDLSMPGSPLASNNQLRQDLCDAAQMEIDSIWRPQVIKSTSGAAIDFKSSTMSDRLLAWQPLKHIYAPWVHEHYESSSWDSTKTLMAAHTEEVQQKMRERWHASNTAMYLWNKSILINVVLACQGDRSEMANSIEGRTPFLDHQLVQYVNSLPPSVKIAYMPPPESGESSLNHSAFQSLSEKWILREAAKPYITKELYDRRKVTFWAPSKWPEGGSLQKMFSKLLTKEAVENLGFVNYEIVEKALERAFGDDADLPSFRIVCYAGNWVAISQKFGVMKATAGQCNWT